MLAGVREEKGILLVIREKNLLCNTHTQAFFPRVTNTISVFGNR